MTQAAETEAPKGRMKGLFRGHQAPGRLLKARSMLKRTIGYLKGRGRSTIYNSWKAWVSTNQKNPAGQARKYLPDAVEWKRNKYQVLLALSTGGKLGPQSHDLIKKVIKKMERGFQNSIPRERGKCVLGTILFFFRSKR